MYESVKNPVPSPHPRTRWGLEGLVGDLIQNHTQGEALETFSKLSCPVGVRHRWGFVQSLQCQSQQLLYET